jgi:hypothetical protein
MFDPQHMLISQRIADVVAMLEAAPGDGSAWSGAEEVRPALGPEETAIVAALDARDAAALAALLTDWRSGRTLLPERDRAVLHSALKAFKKSMKLTRLDDESRIGGGAMSGGRRSGIVGIPPPGRFHRSVFDQLVRQGRLKSGGQGVYELPPNPPTGS